MPKKSFSKKLFDELKGAGLPDLKYTDRSKTISCPQGKIIAKKGEECILTFFYHNEDEKLYKGRDIIKNISFPKDYDLAPHLYIRKNGTYTLSYEWQFKKIMKPLVERINRIIIAPGKTGITVNRGILKMSPTDFEDAIQKAGWIYKRKNSYASSIENHLAGVVANDITHVSRKHITSIEKGEFSFTVDRFNLSTKKKKADFLKYLDQDDISKLEALLSEMIRNEVFSEEYLQKLDDYFIKERLREIISLGRKILALGSTKMTTKAAMDVAKLVNSGSIGQLEGLWQKYFEKNLLYLIFSYKKIFPKVKLTDIDGAKKYPDFIGINHYNGLDVIEIKTHLKNILIWDDSHKNYYFSPEMSKAIVQTMNYLDSISRLKFQNSADERAITGHTEEENLYHPRGIIVISSREKLTTSARAIDAEKLKRDFTKLRNSLQSIEIITFDEIIDIADEYIKNIVP